MTTTPDTTTKYAGLPLKTLLETMNLHRAELRIIEQELHQRMEAAGTDTLKADGLTISKVYGDETPRNYLSLRRK